MIKIPHCMAVFLLVGGAVAAQQRGDSAKAPARADTGEAKPKTASDSLRAHAAAIDALRSRLDSIENRTSKVISFGIGLGYRLVGISATGKYQLFELSISPYDSTLQIDTLARSAFILSGVVTARPFKNRFLFMADVNLAEFASKDAFAVSNKAVEGGAGFGLQLDPSFSLGLAFERISRRIPRAFVFQRIGQKVPGPNGPVTHISLDDDTFYRDANHLSITIWFIYRLK